VRHRRKAPDPDSDCQPDPQTDSIHEPPRKEQSDAIGRLKRKDDRGVVTLSKTKLALQYRLEQADYLAINLIDRRRKKQKTTNHPSESCGWYRLRAGLGGIHRCEGVYDPAIVSGKGIPCASAESSHVFVVLNRKFL
jgi:hypothetical protein